jgi:hypothetical protein
MYRERRQNYIVLAVLLRTLWSFSYAEQTGESDNIIQIKYCCKASSTLVEGNCEPAKETGQQRNDTQIENPNEEIVLPGHLVPSKYENETVKLR